MTNERKRMTESTMEQKLCIVGEGTDSPCPFPATVALPHRRLPEGEEWLCAYHAATEPLVKESNEFGVCRELVRAYLKGARRQLCGAPG
jgi:hypothetical protein